MEKLSEAFDKLNDEHLKELQRGLDIAAEKEKQPKPDYTVRRKVIYKGTMAPKGGVYIVVKVKSGKRAFEAVQLIPGGLTPETEQKVAESLREMIKNKYHC